MRKKMVYVVLTAIVITAFTKDKSYHFNGSGTVRFNLPDENAIAHVSKDQEDFEVFYSPAVDNNYVGFKEAIAFKESRGNYRKVNSLGYVGKYQFGEATLHRVRVYDIEEFLNDPKLQEEAFYALCSLNKWILKRDIARSVGKVIHGTIITESGILAAAHLAGAGNVKRYLRSNGQENANDAFGTDVAYYMKRFAGFDTSFVKPVKNATV